MAAPVDNRAIEVLASGMPCYNGKQLAVDVTLRVSLGREGNVRGTAHWKDASILEEARRDKEAKYPELHRGDRCQLIVLAIDIGGRFSTETVEFLENLAWARSRAAPSYLRTAVAHSFKRRWARMLAVAAGVGVSTSLVLSKEELQQYPAGDGQAPWLMDVLGDARHDLGPGAAAPR